MRLAPAVLALALAGLPQLSASSPACADPMLRLNEILAGPARDWDGSGAFSSRDDEWVEVANIGAAAIDLSSFLITDGDSIPRYAFTGSLAAGGHLVVFGSQSTAWERATSHPVFGFSLGNTGDEVILWQVAGAETLVVDRYAYRSHEAAPDRASGRLPDGTGAWSLFDALDPYTGTLTPRGNNCPPTPGAVNVCDSTPAAPSTWGRLKALYR